MSWEGARVVAERLVVPSNCSRLLLTRDLAVGVPTATVELAWNDEDPYLFNARFEGSKIVHDDAYCTSVVDLEQVVQIPTLSCLHDRVLPQLLDAPTVIDIGCGQGEFVSALRAADVNAAGFDPVLRTESEHLHRRYWTPGEGPADLFVMRCVLPHIAEPWSFLEEIAAASPRGMVLIEFQRLEWILAESVWYQISHDHVNVFSVDDFEARYEVVDNGIFSNGEWAWVLIRPGAVRAPRSKPWDLDQEMTALVAARAESIRMAGEAGPVAVWGAAGKGIVLAHALLDAGVEVLMAVDADPLRWGLFMEASGVPVVRPHEALAVLPESVTLLVCNPNHLAAVEEFVSPRRLAVRLATQG